MKYPKILGLTALALSASLFSDKVWTHNVVNKAGSTFIEAASSARPLQAGESLLFLELADENLRILPNEVSEPLIKKVLADTKVNASVGGRVLKRFWVINAKDMRNTDDRARVIKQLRSNPAVRTVSENRIYKPAAFNDPGYPSQERIYTGANQTSGAIYDSEFVKLIERTPGTNEPQVRVAVLDTGISPSADLNTQFDIQANFVEGVDYDSTNERFISNSTAFADATEPANSGSNGGEPFYHGSKVHSLINAVSDNSSGIVGIDRNLRVSQIRVLADSGGDSISVIFGLLWSTGLYDRFVAEVGEDPNFEFFADLPPNSSPANIVNLSLGGNGESCSSFEQAAIDFVLNNSSTFIVAAAGNSALYGEQVPSAPANCNGVISVGASTTRFGDASYSNVSPALVTSTLGGEPSVGDNLPLTEPSTLRSLNGVSFASGTSFSTPLVSAVLATALRLGLSEGVTSSSLVQTLRETGHEFQDSESYCVQITDPVNNPKPCGTILNTSAFLLAVTGIDVSGVQTTPPPESVDLVEPTPENNDNSSTQPVSGGGELPGEPENANPTESASFQFTGTVNNVDPASIVLAPEDSSIDPSSYSVSFARDNNSFVVNISIPGLYRLSFEADRVTESSTVQPAQEGQTVFVSDVTLNSTTREITATDPIAQETAAEAPPVGNTSNPTPAGGGGGGAITLLGLLGLAVLMLFMKVNKSALSVNRGVFTAKFASMETVGLMTKYRTLFL